MDAVSLIVSLSCGAVAGAVAALAIARRAHRRALDAALVAAGADARAQLAATAAKLDARDRELHALHDRFQQTATELREVQAALSDARVATATLETRLAQDRLHANEKLSLLTQARDELSAHFRALAGEALEVNRARITEQQHGTLDRILKPLGDKLAAFEKKVEETYDKEAQQRASLRQEVLNLQAATLQINEDARNLTLALKGEAKTRGNWGEVILERVLERSGLVEGVEYHAQHALRDEDGALSRPDIVVRLPGDKHVVIDSKVSLVAYDRYHAADDDAARTHAGRQHVDGMRRHVRSLGEKNYQSGSGVDSPDFVAMFVPIEPAFGLASSLDADLFLDAWNHKVVIVTPSTLLALLMTVQSLWQRDKQTRNAIEIAEQSGALHTQFVRVMESLKTLGKQLRDAQKTFELTESRLFDGPGNLVRRIERLRELGAKTKKQLPPDLLARAADESRDDATDDDPASQPPSKLTLVPPPSEDAVP